MVATSLVGPSKMFHRHLEYLKQRKLGRGINCHKVGGSEGDEMADAALHNKAPALKANV